MRASVFGLNVMCACYRVIQRSVMPLAPAYHQRQPSAVSFGPHRRFCQRWSLLLNMNVGTVSSWGPLPVMRGGSFLCLQTSAHPPTLLLRSQALVSYCGVRISARSPIKGKSKEKSLILCSLFCLFMHHKCHFVCRFCPFALLAFHLYSISLWRVMTPPSSARLFHWQ